jgi:hypothetical protein
MKLADAQQKYHPNRSDYQESADLNSFTPLSKVWLPSCGVSRNSHSINFFGHILYRNVIQLERKLHNITGKKVFSPLSKVCLHYMDFHKTRNWLVTLREDLLHQIWPKSIKIATADPVDRAI